MSDELGQIIETPTISKFMEAFVAAQQKFTVAMKDKEADVVAREGRRGFKYSYADLVAVRAACVPHLNSHGIGVMQPAISDGRNVTVWTILMHVSGESIRAPFTLSGGSSPQMMGGATTYAKRIALQAMTGVVAADEDDDAQDWRDHREDERRQTSKSPPVQQQTTTPDDDEIGVEIKRIKAGIAGAKTVEDMNALGRRIAVLPEGERAQFRDAWQNRQAEIKKASNGEARP